MTKRKKTEVLAARALARTQILQSLKRGRSKSSEFEISNSCERQDVTFVLQELKNEGKIHQTGEKRGARYFLRDVEGAQEEPQEIKFEGSIDEAFEDFVSNMPGGLVGKVQARPPASIARDFSAKYDFPLEQAWKMVSGACKDGILDYESRFEGGYRFFAWKA